MSEKLYYWVDNSEDYTADNDPNFSETIEIKRLNFFIGKNNAGKSRFLRKLFQTCTDFKEYQRYDLSIEVHELSNYLERNSFKRPTIRGQDRTWSSDGSSPVSEQEKFQVSSDLNFLIAIKFNLNEIKSQFSQVKSVLSFYKLATNNSKNELVDLLRNIENILTRISAFIDSCPSDATPEEIKRFFPKDIIISLSPSVLDY